MDTSAILEQYTQDLANLPSELAHLLQELREKDLKLYESRKKLLQRDNQIHKFIRQNGSLTKNPKEQQLYGKIEEDFRACERIQEQKNVLANTALFLVSKYLLSLDNDMDKLEREGLLAPVEDGMASATPPVSSLAVVGHRRTMTSVPQVSKHARTKSMRLATPTGSAGAARKRQKTEELEEKKVLPTSSLAHLHLEMPLHMGEAGEDETIYCFCRQVSYGNMIGCDNDDCRFEWFHWDCVGLKEQPKEGAVWYCSDCKERMKKDKE
ncbi:hypothetical protein BABINDRAFT_17989, partial [Babjeviella inositovora NRRL Y-12698]